MQQTDMKLGNTDYKSIALGNTDDEDYVTMLKDKLNTQIAEYVSDNAQEPVLIPSIAQKVWLTALLEHDASWGIYPYIRDSDKKQYVNFRVQLINTNPGIVKLLHSWYGGTVHTNQYSTKFHRKKIYAHKIDTDRGVHGVLWQNAIAMLLIQDILPYTVTSTASLRYMLDCYTAYIGMTHSTEDYATMRQWVEAMPLRHEAIGYRHSYSAKALKAYMPWYIGGLFDAKGSIALSLRNKGSASARLHVELRIRCGSAAMYNDVAAYLEPMGIRVVLVEPFTLCITQNISVWLCLRMLVPYLTCKQSYVQLLLDYAHFSIPGSVQYTEHYLVQMLRDYWAYMRAGIGIRATRDILQCVYQYGNENVDASDIGINDDGIVPSLPMPVAQSDGHYVVQ